MPADPKLVRDLFLTAAEMPPTDRESYLADQCGDDAELHAAVERLLAAHEAPAPILESASAPEAGPSLAATLPDAKASAAENHVPSELATGDFRADGTIATIVDGSRRIRGEFVSGQVIAGRYTLRAVLGEGGMGTVYRAEQTEPVKRQVALKLIKIGMDSRAVLARFDAERQALAMMDHPNIARVYDGGTTESGQPFFVMELVNGVPITEYCDRHRLPVKARLELFVAACQAVQHAHQKGVIHRDIKPSNVMVTEVDGRPTPKVIDFGVAKATEVSLTDQSVGDTGAIVGTPTYMSPEQADPSSMDIDTRTDVYALGVILYELLAGSPPLDASQFKRGALLEMLRMVREVDPSRPSTKVSTSVSLPNIASSRDIDPARLQRALAGDLDWIVMKALEKDRTRRYDTANGFAADILRHLASEPVLAAPPSRSYRMRKFVRKNRGVVLAASLIFISLVGGLAVSLWQMNRAIAAEALARTNEAKAPKSEGLAKEQRARAEERETQAIDAVKRFRDAIASEPELKNTPALDALRKRLLKEPLAFFKNLREQLEADNDTRPEALARLASAAFDLGNITNEIGDKRDAIRAYDSAREIQERLAREHPTVTAYGQELAMTYDNLGLLLRETGDPAGSRREHEAAREIFERLAREHPTVTAYAQELALTHNNVGFLLRDTGDLAGARRSMEAAREIQERLAREHPTVTDYARELARTQANLGKVLSETGDAAGSRREHEAAREIFERLAREHPTVTTYGHELAMTHDNLGNLLGDTGDLAGAQRSYEAAREILEPLAREHPEMPDVASHLGASLNNITMIDLDEQRFAKARNQLLRAIEWQRKALAANPRNPQYRQFLGNHLNNLVRACNGLNDAESAADAERELATLSNSTPESFTAELKAEAERLSAIIRGDQQPKDNAERLRVAQAAYDRSRFATAARFWVDALAADPKVVNDRIAQHRYTAACAASLAGSGQGKEEPAPDEAARARLREQALAWLKAELSTWKRVSMTVEPGNKEAVVKALTHWKGDADLAGIRDDAALAKLPEQERAAFKRLWTDVDALLTRMEGHN
jgi:serine/threonine protein kinase/tetratricopeptide (TPR) repeat protein